METYIYLVEVYKYRNNNKELNHYVFNAYTTKEKAIEAAKDLIKILKTEKDKIIAGDGINCIGGIRNTMNNDSEIFWINEVMINN